MKTLLPLNHATYLRRLARELNALPDGFYQGGKRWNRARCVGMPCEGRENVMLQISRPSDDGDANSTESTGFSTHEGVEFSDAYGRSVCASRRA